MRIRLPYSTGHMEFDLPEERLLGIIRSRVDEVVPAASPEDTVRAALGAPIGSSPLPALAASAGRVLLVTSDHTRPVPSRVTIPLLLEQIRSSNPWARVTILVGTGCHRPPTEGELAHKLGPDVVRCERIVIHDCRDRAGLVYKGRLPSGAELWLNKLVAESDLTIAEGVVEPHFFAGFSGGPKSVLPGIAGESSVYGNHCAEFIAHPAVRAGNLAGNPVREDMIWAARVANLRFILNVILNGRKEIVKAFAGHPEAAHGEACQALRGLAEAPAIPADVVITSNGGYPFDQNIYQAVKGISTAAATVKGRGVIIAAAACEDGHGGQAFHDWFRRFPSPAHVARAIAAVPRAETTADQWEAQVLAGVLVKHRVILLSDRCDPGVVRDMHLLPASRPEEALALAASLVGEDATITAVPDGISTIVKPREEVPA